MSGAPSDSAWPFVGVGRRSALLAVLVAGLLVPAGVAQGQQPTLQFDRACYTDNQEMRFTGAGYTPDGQVDLLFTRPMEVRGMYTTRADAAGSLNDYTGVADAAQLIDDDEEREAIFVTANDRTRIDSGQQPPESQFGVAQFTFTRWEGFSPGRYVPGKRVAVEVYGWAFDAGKTAWFQFRKGARLMASVKIGQLDQQCGDRAAKIRVPRNLKPGAYRLVLSTKQRAVVVLRYWAELSIEETAGALGVSPGTVKSTLHRALRVLRQELTGRETAA